MTQLTLTLPDDLVARLAPAARWMPTILELSMVGFATPAAAVAAELIHFLASNPSPQEVRTHHASAVHQERLRRLLALNEAGLLSEDEQRELDEIERIEHLVILLKADAAGPERNGA